MPIYSRTLNLPTWFFLSLHWLFFPALFVGIYWTCPLLWLFLYTPFHSSCLFHCHSTAFFVFLCHCSKSFLLATVWPFSMPSPLSVACGVCFVIVPVLHYLLKFTHLFSAFLAGCSLVSCCCLPLFSYCDIMFLFFHISRPYTFFNVVAIRQTRRWNSFSSKQAPLVS